MEEFAKGGVPALLGLNKGVQGKVFGRLARLFPQDASGDLQLCPITSRLCEFCSFGCLVIAAFAHLTCEYHEKRPAVAREEDWWLPWCLQLTATLSIAGLLYEVCINSSLSALGLKSVYQQDETLRNRLRLNVKMIVVFSILTTCYHCMAFDIQWVHKGWLAEMAGGHQIVYSVRYIEWTCCAPIVFSISGQLELAPDGTPRNGIIPSALLTGLYCIISWQGLVVKSHCASVLCITWAFLGYVVASVEQFYFAWYLTGKGRAGPLRAGLLIYLIIMVGIYGVVFLLPIPGWISATMENKFYCVFDASFKLGTSGMLIAVYDLSLNEEMRRRAQTVTADLQGLIETASVPILGVGRDLTINQWNQKVSEITGVPKEEAFGKELLQMFGEGEVVRGVIQQAMNGESTGYLETLLGAQCSAEEATHDSDGTSDSRLNSEAQNAGGLSKDSLPLVQEVLASSRPGDPGGTGNRQVFWRLSSKASPSDSKQPSQNVRGRNADAKGATLILSCSPLRDRTGIVKGVMLVGCDLTEIKAYKEAESRKTQFMAVVSHELRSPLHGIIGLVGRLREDEEEAPKAQLLKLVSSCASRLSDLVVNIMEMATLSQKDSSGRPKTLNLHRDPVNLPNLIEDILTLIRSSVDKAARPLLKHDVVLKSELGPLPIIEADAHRCTQVFYNLVTNACKFTNKGSITVWSCQDPSSRWVEVRVTDTGRGIPERALEQIFRPFEQEDNSDTRQFEGVGLGLPIAYEVVRLHGGRISVESELGVGTTFAVRLPTIMGQQLEGLDLRTVTDDPLPRIAAEGGAICTSSTLPTIDGRQDGAWPLILSVDDEEINQMVIEQMLSPEYKVHSVSDGHAALTYLRNCGDQLPHCVLLNVVMPGMSGFEVCTQIRQNLMLDAQDLPVLMLSAHIAPSSFAKAEECGSNEYITKPFDKTVLKAHVSTAIKIIRRPRQDELLSTSRRRTMGGAPVLQC